MLIATARSLRDYAISVPLSIDKQAEDDCQVEPDHEHGREEDVRVPVHDRVDHPEHVREREQDPRRKRYARRAPGAINLQYLRKECERRGEPNAVHEVVERALRSRECGKRLEALRQERSLS